MEGQYKETATRLDGCGEKERGGDVGDMCSRDSAAKASDEIEG